LAHLSTAIAVKAMSSQHRAMGSKIQLRINNCSLPAQKVQDLNLMPKSLYETHHLGFFFNPELQ
jgi:hypothetical protein